MLWVKGNVTTGPIIRDVILPSMVTLLLPLLLLSFTMKGTIETPVDDDNADEITSPRARLAMLLIGVAALLFVPVFKTITHLPPYMGMLFGLGVIWLVTEFALRTRGHKYDRRHFSVIGVLRKIDTPTIFFFLGILTAVAALQSAGHLAQLAGWLDDVTGRNIYAINLVIGVLSSIVDNVPLVAGAMGMYNIGAGEFAVDGAFWQLLAYCAGTGGSILIIGSAAGVAAMGLEKINFIWYFKKISYLALIGYLGGAAVYYLQHILLH
jgi:Na+/H+ antiporter NhaD/arsenite permease-like protein